MISQDNTLLNSILKDNSNKDILCHTDKDIFSQLSISTNNLLTYLAFNCSKYEVAQMINSNDKYLKIKNKKFTKINYSKRQIIMVELGVNFNKLSYKHPCVVLADLGDKLFVAPCTSGNAPRDKEGKIFKGYLEGNFEDGFEHLTTIICKECLCIDKSQVISAIKQNKKYKKISLEMYEKINNNLFKSLFGGTYYKMSMMEKEIDDLKLQLEKLSREKIELEKEIDDINKKNKRELQSAGMLGEVAVGEE